MPTAPERRSVLNLMDDQYHVLGLGSAASTIVGLQLSATANLFVAQTKSRVTILGFHGCSCEHPFSSDDDRGGINYYELESFAIRSR